MFMNSNLAMLILLSSISLAQVTSKSKITINDPWIRPAVSGTNTGLFFEVINNTGKADTLIGAKSNLSTMIELHETYQKSEGVMGMRAVHAVAIPANSSVRFRPRDLHIMLIELKKDMRLGSTGEVKLRFKYAGLIRIKAIVRDMASVK
jgi:periplasmic copper chaperone A